MTTVDLGHVDNLLDVGHQLIEVVQHLLLLSVVTVCCTGVC